MYYKLLVLVCFFYYLEINHSLVLVCFIMKWLALTFEITSLNLLPTVVFGVNRILFSLK